SLQGGPTSTCRARRLRLQGGPTSTCRARRIPPLLEAPQRRQRGGRGAAVEVVVEAHPSGVPDQLDAVLQASEASHRSDHGLAGYVQRQGGGGGGGDVVAIVLTQERHFAT